MVRTRSQTSTFRFLDLPPEIRLHVYEELLGGALIHVGHLKGIYNAASEDDTVYVCKAEVTDATAAQKQIEAASEGAERPPMFTIRHRDCGRERQSELKKRSFSVVLTSRTIYEEARTVIFKANSFAFNSPVVLRHFLQNRLRPHQRANISTITLYQTNNYRTWSGSSAISLAASELPGLQHLTIYVELCPADLESSLHQGNLHQGNLVHKAAQDELLIAAKPLCSTKLKSFNIHVVEGLTNSEYGRLEWLPMQPEGSAARQMLKPENLRLLALRWKQILLSE